MLRVPQVACVGAQLPRLVLAPDPQPFKVGPCSPAWGRAGSQADSCLCGWGHFLQLE